MDDVKVHYNSDKSAQLQAHAYAQGSDIHIGPEQEKHLPHEAWHVVQQKQGQVKPTMQMKRKVNSISKKLKLKLEFNNKRALAPRAKSAPPRRPPPPPVRTLPAPIESPAKAEGSNAALLIKDASPPKLKDEEPLPIKTPAPERQQKSDMALVAKGAATKIPMQSSAAPFQSPEAVSSTNPISPPSTIRRDRIQQFRQGLDTPQKSPEWAKVKTNDTTTVSQPIVSATNERLEDALKKAEEEKNQALKQIKELETKLVQNMATIATPLTPVKDMTSLQEVMNMAKSHGEEAALKWAHQQLSSQQKSGGLLSPGIPTTPVGLRSVSKRVATPYPKREGLKTQDADGNETAISDEELERQFIDSFREAIAYVPHEYFGSASISSNIGNDGSNQLCTFYVRRPYGSPPQSEIFDLVSPSPHDAYSRKAHVSDPSTVQVAVAIPYDESVLCLFGHAGIRYRITPTGNFESYPNIGEKSFGSVSYIDDTANEQEYSLDQIIEEALAVREQYCSTMMTTALGFQRRKPDVQAPAPVTNPGNVAEIGVNTMPAEIDVGNDIAKQKVEDKPQIERSTKEKKPVIDDDSSGAADVLTIFLGMVVKSIFGFIFWITMGIAGTLKLNKDGLTKEMTTFLIMLTSVIAVNIETKYRYKPLAAFMLMTIID